MKQEETILKELKQLDYELFTRTQKSHLSEAQWDWLIENFKEASTKLGHCKDCKYFEYDSFAKVNGIPLIVAHEICSKWGDGCKTEEDGYCFLFESKEEKDE